MRFLALNVGVVVLFLVILDILIRRLANEGANLVRGSAATVAGLEDAVSTALSCASAGTEMKTRRRNVATSCVIGLVS